MTPSTDAKLICAECRHENEAERIYCHNCGERLDRSAIVTKKKADNAEETHRRLRKLMQGPSRTRQNFFTACKLALGAALAAGVIQMLLPPEFPEAVKVTSPIQMDLELEGVLQKGIPITYSEHDINAYLTYRLAGKKKVLNKPFLNFERAAVALKEGVCTIGWERSFFGYPLYSRMSYRVDGSGINLKAVSNGGWIGRMPIHPAVLPYANIIFKDVFFALDRERKMVAKMNTVAVHDASVTLIPPVR